MSSHMSFSCFSVGLTLDEMTANSIVFFLAGYDTTASTLTFLSYHLAMNQNIQDKVREEIDRIIGQVRAY